jgi:hypothetical protein
VTRSPIGVRLFGAALLGATLLALAPETWGAPAKSAAESPSAVTARVFKIQFKDPSDVAQLVGQLLSDRGSVTFSPKLKTLTVQDRRDVLDRVRDVINSYDLPPRNVQLTVTLILASMGDQAAKQPISREVRGIADSLLNLPQWTEYKTLGSSAISGSEGGKASVDIGDFRIEFDIESVSESRGIIRLNPLVLQRAVKGADGAVNYRPVYRQTCNLTNDRLLTIGATKSESDSKAVFLAIRARIQSGEEESLAHHGSGAAGKTPRNR